MDINRLLTQICTKYNIPTDIKYIIILKLAQLNIKSDIIAIFGASLIIKLYKILQKYTGAITGSFPLSRLLNLSTKTNDMDIFVTKLFNHDTNQCTIFHPVEILLRRYNNPNDKSAKSYLKWIESGCHTPASKIPFIKRTESTSDLYNMMLSVYRQRVFIIN
jgi:hypothetical protein